MFKHNFDFGFQLDESKRVDEDLVDPREAAMFLDCKDADDLAEDLDIPVEELCASLTASNLGVIELNEESVTDPLLQSQIRLKPILDTSSIDFGPCLLSLIVDLQGNQDEKELHDSLYDLVLHASPDLLKLILESVGNSEQVALALQRLRIIIGVSEIDIQLEYQYYYIFSYCNDQMFDGPFDWENIISLTMDQIVNEIFMGSIYFTSDHEINIILLPSNLTECELELIRSHRIWGIKMKENLLGDLDLFLQLENELTEEAQHVQLMMMEKFMHTISHKFPNLSTYKLGQMHNIGSYLARFNWIREEIDKFLPSLLDEETERQAELLMPHMQPIIS